MKKKIIPFTLVLIIVISGALGITALAVSAIPTPSTVYVDGKVVSFEAYNIGGYNYFKLRDIAFVLNGTEKQFEVGYDAQTKDIALTSGEPYTAVGGEMAAGNNAAKEAIPTESVVVFHNWRLDLTAYNIGGNNFFKLRDLMVMLGVYVGYDDTTKAITLDTSKGYMPDGALLTEQEARAALSAWMDGVHPDMEGYNLDRYSCDILGYNGVEFYRFYYYPMYFLEFLVNCKTGELWCRQISDGEFAEQPIVEPLEDYYNRYYGAVG